MTPENYRNPISLFDSLTTEDLTRFGVRMGSEFELVLNGQHPDRSRNSDYRQFCANSFRLAVGPVGHITSEYGNHRSEGYTQWHFTGDGSLSRNPDDSNGVTVELVSPIIDYADFGDAYRRLHAWASDRTDGQPRVYTNNSTGMHTGVSASNPVSTERFDPMLFSLLVDDYSVLSRCGRLRNSYVPPTFRAFFDNADCAEIQRAISARRPLRDTMAGIAHSCDLDDCRYSVNYSHLRDDVGYVEFRSPGGDWMNLPIEYVISMHRRIALAYLAASGKISHPDLDALYRSRMSYALQGNDDCAAKTASFFLSNVPDGIVPTALDHLINRGVWFNIGAVHGRHIIMLIRDARVDFYSNPDTDTIAAYGFGELPSTSNLRGEGATTIRDGVFNYIGDNTGHSGTRDRARMNWFLSVIPHLRVFAVSPLRLKAAAVRSFRTSSPGLSLREYVSASDRILQHVESLTSALQSVRTREIFRSSAHRIWRASVSDRVRRAAIVRSVANIRAALPEMNVSTATISSISSLLDAVQSQGEPLPRNRISGSFDRLRANPSLCYRELALLQAFPEIGVTPESISDYVRQNQLAFISVDHTVSVFTQPTDMAPYLRLRQMLSDVIDNDVPAPYVDTTASQTTHRIRRLLMNTASSLTRSVRRAWCVSGNHAVIADRLGSRAIRPYVLGEAQP